MPSEPLALAELAERLTRDERLLGLDVGTKTIGLATCDSSWSFATIRGSLGGGQAPTKFTVFGEVQYGLQLHKLQNRKRR